MVNKLLPFKPIGFALGVGSCFENQSRAKPKKSNTWNLLMIIRPSITMLRLVAGTVLLLLVGLAEALAVEEIKKDNVGPWEIEATFKGNKFDHCAISRKVDEVLASFLRTSDGLTLTLESPNWKLERGKNYPVRMKAGAASWNTDVAAENNSVSVAISDKKFMEGLRAANAFVVEGAGATIRIPLDQSRAALERLEKCLTKNSRAVETNPFVAPTRQP
jgi:hypothetical protein